jgi:integrase
MGVAATVHGFRTSFRTWAGETGVIFEVAEHCLSHAVGNAASQAYNRTTLLERRRPVMTAWGAYVSKADGKIVAINGRRKRS